MVSMYNNASSAEKESFDQHIRAFLNDPVTEPKNFLNFVAMCPHLGITTPLPDRPEFRHFRHAIYKLDALNLVRLVYSGAPCHDNLVDEFCRYFYWGQQPGATSRNYVINWCCLVGALIRKQSAETSSAWYHGRPETNEMMTQVLFRAADYDSLTVNGGEFLGSLVKHIKAGIIA